MTAFSLFSLIGQKALVTGAAQGIGKASAFALATAGADVAIIDHNSEAGEKTAKAIRSIGGDAFFVQCNIADKEQVKMMMQTVVSRFGRLDIAVNSAGVGPKESGINQSSEDWERVIGINLTGTWFCAQTQAQQMSQQTPKGGKIINIASAAARSASDNTSYCAAKAAIIHLTRSLAMQLGGSNINVNSISPGVVMTPLVAAYPIEFRQRLRDITPAGYIARPQDISGPVLFLASSASDFVTGHDLLMDGGRTLSTWIDPLERHTPPRVSIEDESIDMKLDLADLGVDFDENGVPR
jgi:sorbose reductase